MTMDENLQVRPEVPISSSPPAQKNPENTQKKKEGVTNATGINCSIFNTQEQPAISIAAQANSLAHEANEIQSARLEVFKAFCNSFDQTASQFTAGHTIAFTKDFGESFLQYWSQVLHNNKMSQPKVPLPNTKPTYANLVAKPQGKQKQRLPQQPQAAPQQKQFIAPKDDLRVLIRLDKEAPARNRIATLSGPTSPPSWG